MARSSNFTDSQKAELYVLHRATCAYSGEKLWILDGGAGRSFTIDWADHIHPVAKGGLSTIENGVCASWFHNRAKRDSTKAPVFLFFNGKPQSQFLKINGPLSRQISKDLVRFSRLHPSDWYFNRALFRVLLGVDYLDNGIGVRSRDDRYYASAALKIIGKWRRIASKASVPSLEERGLAPNKPSPDQKLLLRIRDAETILEIRRLMKQLLPFYRIT